MAVTEARSAGVTRGRRPLPPSRAGGLSVRVRRPRQPRGCRRRHPDDLPQRLSRARARSPSAQAVQLAPHHREQRDQAALPPGAGAAEDRRAGRPPRRGGRRRRRPERRRASHRSREDPAAAAPGDRPPRVRGPFVCRDRRDSRRDDLGTRDPPLPGPPVARRGARATAHVHRGAASRLEVRRRTARQEGAPSAARSPRRVPGLRAVRATPEATPQRAPRADAAPDPALLHSLQGARRRGHRERGDVPSRGCQRARSQPGSEPAPERRPRRGAGCSRAGLRSRLSPQSPP